MNGKFSKEETARNTHAVIDRLNDLGFKGNIVLPIKDREFGTIKAEWFIDPNDPPAILKGGKQA